MAWAEPIKSGYRGRYRDANGDTQTAGDAPTQKAAKQLAQAEELKIAAGTWIDPKRGRVTFADYFEQTWFPNLTLELHTTRSYWSSYTKHLKPYFGDRELRAINSTLVQKWVTSLIAAGYSPAMINKLHIHLQTVLAGRRGNSARRDRYIEFNPCEGTSLPFMPTREVHIYEPDEVAALVEVMDPWWRLMPLFWSQTGLRWGELAGLKVIDFALGFVSFDVRRTIAEVGRKWTDNGSAFVEKGYTKTGKPRVVAVHRNLRPLLAAHVEARGLGPEDRLFAMPAKKAEHVTRRVLSTEPKRTELWPGGMPVSRGHFRKQVWERAHTETGIRQLRPYDLRATHISWLLDGGAPLPVVMELVGHSQTKTTQKYTKARRVETAGLEALDKVFGQSPGSVSDLRPDGTNG